MKPANPTSWNLKWTALAALCISLFSCGTDPFPVDPNDPKIYTLDSLVYFTINVNGNSYTSYGIKTLGEPTNSPLLRGSYYVRVVDTLQGSPANYRKLTSYCLGSLGNVIIANTNLPRNKVDFFTMGQTNGDMIDTYLLTDTPTVKLLQENLSYRVDLTKNYQYRINAIDSLYTEGTFSFSLLETGTNRSLPASGSFRLNNLNP
jgi:hypothetical protein